jgi:hypothetical protein
MTSAERQKRYRARRRAAAVTIPATATVEQVAQIVDRWVAAQPERDQLQLANDVGRLAVGALHERWERDPRHRTLVATVAAEWAALPRR